MAAKKSTREALAATAEDAENELTQAQTAADEAHAGLDAAMAALDAARQRLVAAQAAHREAAVALAEFDLTAADEQG